MDTHVRIPLEEFPEEGMKLAGEVDGALFGLEETGVQSAGPMSYELEARLYDTELLVRGYVAAPFRLRCDRCLREFDYTVEVEGVTLSYDVKGKEVQDITEDLREEVVLELPGYPKCELADLECEKIEGFDDFRLDKDPLSGVNSATPSGKSVWDALDQLSEK